MARPRVGDWSPTEEGWGAFFLPGRIWPVFSLSFSGLFPCIFKWPSDGEEKPKAILLDPNFITWRVLRYYDAGFSHALNMRLGHPISSEEGCHNQADPLPPT